MSIEVLDKGKFFHLSGPNFSYCIALAKGGYPYHAYFGAKLSNPSPERLVQFMLPPCTPNPDAVDQSYSLDVMSHEYPMQGTSDYRNPAFQIVTGNGGRVLDLLYESHRIIDGKPALEGLPASFASKGDAESLEIVLVDSVSKVKVALLYSIFKDLNVVVRSSRILNTGIDAVLIESALSASIDFDDAEFDFLRLHGTWIRETCRERTPLSHGVQFVESKRGASSNYYNPFMALCRKGSTEETGVVYGFNLVYSGNFIARAEVNHYRFTRAAIGINPYDFSWKLEANEAFQTPEAVLVFSETGLGGMSRSYHDFYRKHLINQAWVNKERPILVNSWEAAYFNVNEELSIQMGKMAKEVGIELFALDDGWFGKRDSDASSLGDWYENKEKFPHGLAYVQEEIAKAGTAFGIWVEPESISPDSDLYRAHPDWIIKVDGRRNSVSRNQYTLDLSKKVVQDFLIETFTRVIRDSKAVYVKWDMNRHMTEIGSIGASADRQKETCHRYMLGVYRLMDTLTKAFPNILFEGCSAGGGRYDPGMLYYMPQFWASDNSDAWERCIIQAGASLVYPASTLSAHVSVVPNHQVGRTTSLETRTAVAIAGVLGYEFNLCNMSSEERALIPIQIDFYKRIRHISREGDLFRLVDPAVQGPFGERSAAWIFVCKDKSEAIFTFVRGICRGNMPPGKIKVQGLDLKANYKIVGTMGAAYSFPTETVPGDELLNEGINLPFHCLMDFSSLVLHLKRV